ncbi:MAG: T9SS type A sorting domain-containing protein [Bacteroidia bacterium]
MKLKLTIMLFLLLSIKFSVQAQQLLTENFDYTAATPLTSNNWVQVAAASPLLSVANSGLTYTGYNLSAIGNAAKLDTAGQDIYRDLFSSVSTGNIYTSMMINIGKATTTGDYFFAYLPQSSTTNYTSRLYAKAVSTGFYKIGISKGSSATTETTVYSIDSFALNVTSLLVIKYQFNAGLLNDSVMVYNFTSGFPTTEPTIPTVATIGGTTTDATSLGRLAMRQGTAANAPRLLIDGIRSSTSWSDLNTAAVSISPSAYSVAFSTTTTTSTRISWAKNTNYVDSNYTTLVFVKAINPITIGTPNLSANAYSANTDFALANSFYQNDGSAKCMYKGDTSSVLVTGLNQNTLYQVSVLVVKNIDSIYSAAANTSVNTLSTAPRTMLNLLFASSGQTSAKVSWSKPTGYVNANNTMVVYAKAISAITSGTPNTNPLSITADSNFSGNGSNLSLDTNARCVYKGDTTFVNLVGLNAGTNYFIAAYAINDIDSNYSPTVNATGITASAGPLNVKSVTVISLNSATARVSWTKDTSYNNANFTTLVFLKQGSAITQGIPNLNSNGITANLAFSAGSKYQNDTNAFCVYKGDSTFVVADNLNPSTLYYALIYVVSDIDSLYSNPITASGTTRGIPPSNVSGVTVAGLSTTSTKISWTKPVNYSNATQTTLVFVKAGSAITEGTPSRTVTTINAQTAFSSNFSTRYQNDTAAKCVFKGDTNFVNITAINNYTNYHVLIYVIRDADSTYSTTSATGSGTAAPNPPAPTLYTIAQVGNINTTTGVPDSINVRVALRGIVYGVNQRTALQGGLIFVLRDNSGGITVANTASNFGYTPVEGDSIQVFGVISSNRGLLIIGTIDSLVVLGSGKTIAAPKLATRLGENTENDLVRLNIVKFLNKPAGANWTAGQTYNIVTANNDTAAIRIYNSSTLAGTSFPTSTYFHVIGFGAQTSSSFNAPYLFNGYQILPRSTNDIIPYNALSSFNVVTPVTNNNVTITGDSNQTMFTNWTKTIINPLSSSFGPVVYTLVIDTLNGNFRNPIASLVSKSAGIDSTLAITFGQLRTLLVKLGVKTNETKSLKWKVNAVAGPFILSSDTIITNFTLGYGLSVLSQITKTLVAYPNPCNENIFVQLPTQLSQEATIEIVDLTGKVLATKSIDSKSLNEVSVNTNSLTKGIYILKLTTENETFIQKIIKE